MTTAVPVLDRRALNRALLAGQLLLQRARIPALEAVERIAGLQAQAPNPPYVGLWTRVAGFGPDELAGLIERRAVVRMALQRGTIHAVSARAALALVQDAQVWCGLKGVARVAERLRPRLTAFRDEHGRELLDLADAPRPAADTPAPVRYLPEWDNLLRSHDDRTRVMTAEVREALRRPNDVVTGTVLVDGFVAATWGVERGRRHTTLTVEPLRRLSVRRAGAVTAEGKRLLRWLAPEGDREVVLRPPPA